MTTPAPPTKVLGMDPHRLLRNAKITAVSTGAFLAGYILSGQLLGSIATMAIFGIGAWFFLSTDIGTAMLEALKNKEDRKQ